MTHPTEATPEEIERALEGWRYTPEQYNGVIRRALSMAHQSPADCVLLYLHQQLAAMREGYESDQADLIKIAAVAQSLRAQLAASEAERERLMAFAKYMRANAPYQMATMAAYALAGKDPTDE